MPHIIIKLQSGRSHQQKLRIAGEVTKTIIATANCTEDAVSVSIEDIEPQDWSEAVYKPDIAGKAGTLFKKARLRPFLKMRDVRARPRRVCRWPGGVQICR